MRRIRRLIHEMHRRSLWQVLTVYLVASWAVLGGVGTLGEALGLPDWFPRLAFGLLIVGLPIVVSAALVREGPIEEVTTEAAVRSDRSSQWSGFSSWQGLALLVANTMAFLAFAGTAWLLFRGSAPADAVRGDAVSARWDIVLPDSARLALSGDTPHGVWFTALALSPDGHTLAYVGGSDSETQLRVRHSDGRIAAVPETDGAYLPFFSPDGQWVGYFSGGDIRKVHVTGGAPVTLLEGIEYAGGAAWTSVDSIFVVDDTDGRVGWLSAAGGQLDIIPRETDVVWGESHVRFGLPQALPGRDWVLGMLIVTGQIAVMSTETGELRAVTLGGTVPLDSVDASEMLIGSTPRYLRPGFVTYLSHGDGTLMAVPFDLDALTITGAPFPVLNDVRREATLGFGQYTISEDGSLAYVPGGNDALGLLGIVERGGAIDTLPFERGQYHGLRVSADGARAAAFEWYETRGGSAIKVLDLLTGAVTTLSLEAGSHYATGAWSPGGDTLLIKRYDPVSSAPMGLVGYRFSDGQALEVSPDSDPNFIDFHPAGRSMYWSDWSNEVFRTDLDNGSNELTPLRGAQVSVSPDGEWLALHSGSGSISVGRTSGSGGAISVVASGSPDNPEWTSYGSLVYRETRTLMEAQIDVSGELPRAEAVRVYARGPFPRIFHSTHDILPDNRVLAVIGRPETSSGRIKVITEFGLELARH